MKISILTLFPDFFKEFLETSIIKRAIDKGKVSFEIVNIRDFAKNSYGQVDDTPFGGGSGMVMMIEPVVDAINSVKTEDSYIMLMTPAGIPFKEKMAMDLRNKKHLIIICGHYEGIDERITNYIDAEVSIGDYVLTGGEIPAMVVSDAVIRLLDGVIKKESYEEESFSNNLLDYPTYTRPVSYDGYDVPEVLLSGHHANIEKWRCEQARIKTEKNRPDLLD